AILVISLNSVGVALPSRNRLVRTTRTSNNRRSLILAIPGVICESSSRHIHFCSRGSLLGGCPKGELGFGSISRARRRSGCRRNAPLASRIAVGLRGLPDNQPPLAVLSFVIPENPILETCESRRH